MVKTPAIYEVKSKTASATCEAKYEVLERSSPGAEEFSIPAHKPQLDLIWVVDNSPSMVPFIDQIRQNFNSFVASISNQLDLRLILVSKKYGNLGLQLPPSATNGFQIDAEIDSWSALLVGAIAICGKAALTGFYPDIRTDWNIFRFDELEICGQEQMVRTDVKEPYIIQEFLKANSVQGLLRPGANRTFVFVTDDDDKHHGILETFFKISEEQASLPLIFGFVGLLQSSCEISKPGKAYSDAAQRSGGSIFDICARDWSDHFEKLKDVTVAHQPLKISLKVVPRKESLEVFVDNKKLLTSEYTLNGSTIILSRRPPPNLAHKIKVSYKTCLPE